MAKVQIKRSKIETVNLTLSETEVSSHIPTTLRTVFDTGIISNITSFESVRALASKEFSVREDT